MKRWLIAVASVCCVITVGCQTTVTENEPESPEEITQVEDIPLMFKIAQNNYTKVGENDTQVSSLTLAFYKINGSSPEHLYTLTANSDGNSGTYTAMLNTAMEMPDAVVAFANLPESIEIADILNQNIFIENALHSDNHLIMSIASYYNTDSSTNDYIRYAPITEDNLNGQAIEIYLDRIGVKVTMNVSNNITKELVHAIDLSNNKRDLSLELISWDMVGTDRKTYLLKNNGGSSFSEMTGFLGSNGDDKTSWKWNDCSNHTFSWAYSENYQKVSSDFPSPGQETANSITRHLTFSEITNAYGSSHLYHETTRPSTLFNVPNARPSAVLLGQYKLDGEATAQTLYRRGNVIITQDEMCEWIADFNNTEKILYRNLNSKGVLYDKNSIQSSLEGSYGLYMESISDELPNIVTIQINPAYKDINSNISNSEGKRLFPGEVEDINETLKDKFGTWEIFEGGYCFFTIPVIHTGNNFESGKNKTGSFGLVRNHHYNITVQSISSVGHGVKKDAYIGEWPNQGGIGDVKFSVHVNNWIDVYQDIDVTQ